MGCWYPRTGTSPSDTAPSTLPISWWMALEIRSCDPNSLFSPSMREARFTVSPITVYSLRRGEPTLPATTLPRCRPMPMRNGQSLPALCCSMAASISRAARKPKQFRARHKAGEGRKPEVEPQGRKNDEDEVEKRPHKGQGLRRSHVAHMRRDHETRQAGFDERADVTPQLWNIAAPLYLSGDEKENRC